MEEPAPIQNPTEIPCIESDPYSPEILAHPYDFFVEVRETAPVVFVSKYEHYAVGRHEEAAIVLSDYARFTSEGGVGLSDIRKPGALRPKSFITEVDPPEHNSVRSTLQKVLSPRVVREWRADFEREAGSLVDRLLNLHEIDGVRDIAERYVLTVFPQALGVDVPTDRLLILGELNFNQLGPDNKNLRRSLRRAEPILSWYADQLKRDKMLPGGFGEEIFEAEERGEFAPGSAPLYLRSFFGGGVDTTISAIGHALHQLARHPDQYDLLRNDSSMVRNAFDEGMRYESPVFAIYRTTIRDVELGGCHLKADTKVAVYPGAANRDPRRWENPDSFDVRRKVIGQHLSFGQGSHLCLGQMLARLEGECILAALADRARIELNGEASYREVNGLRTLDTLPLRITPY